MLSAARELLSSFSLVPPASSFSCIPSVARENPRVVLMQTWPDEGLLRGVARYANERGWRLDASMRWTQELPDLSLPDCVGVIVQIGTSPRRKELLTHIRKSALPVVDVQGDDSLPAAYRVLVDVEAVARLSVQHCRQRGFHSLCWIGFDEGAQERRMETALEKAAGGLRRIEWGLLGEFLRGTETPVAIVAANDLMAARVVDACRETGRSVPDDVCVLGLGNNELLCCAGPVEISSVDCDREAHGYAAALLLDQGDSLPPMHTPVLIEPRGVIARRSTDTVAISDRSTAMALRFLRDNYTQPITRVQIHAALGSRALSIERFFKKHMGRSMRQELMRLRVEQAKRLMSDDRLKLSEIALRCGFSSRYLFERAFIQQENCTPWTYRQNFRETHGVELPLDVSRTSLLLGKV